MIRFNNQFRKIISVPLYISHSTPGESINNYATDMLIHNKKVFSSSIKQIFCTESYYDNLYKLYFQNKKNLSDGSLINIGGDHHISIATIAASLNHNRNTKLLWISPSNSLNKTPLSYLSAIDQVPSNSVDYIKNSLSFSNIFYVGLNDSNKPLQDTLEQNSISYLFNTQINHHIYDSISDISSFIGDDSVHISIDLNIIDQHYQPSDKIIDKIHIDSLIILLNNLLSRHHILNMDITEFHVCRSYGAENHVPYSNFINLFEEYLRRVS